MKIYFFQKCNDKPCTLVYNVHLSGVVTSEKGGGAAPSDAFLLDAFYISTSPT